MEEGQLQVRSGDIHPPVQAKLQVFGKEFIF